MPPKVNNKKEKAKAKGSGITAARHKEPKAAKIKHEFIELDLIVKLPLKIKNAIFHILGRVDGACLSLTCSAFYKAYHYHQNEPGRCYAPYESNIVGLKEVNTGSPARPLRELIADFFPKDWWYFGGGAELAKKPVFVTTEHLRAILAWEYHLKEEARREFMKEEEETQCVPEPWQIAQYWVSSS